MSQDERREAARRHPKPSVGRVVRYVDPDDHVYAATITHVGSEDIVNLFVDGDGSLGRAASQETSVVFEEHSDEQPAAPYTWHWPPRD